MTGGDNFCVVRMANPLPPRPRHPPICPGIASPCEDVHMDQQFNGPYLKYSLVVPNSLTSDALKEPGQRPPW